MSKLPIKNTVAIMVGLTTSPIFYLLLTPIPLYAFPEVAGGGLYSPLNLSLHM